MEGLNLVKVAQVQNAGIWTVRLLVDGSDTPTARAALRHVLRVIVDAMGRRVIPLTIHGSVPAPTRLP